MNSAAQVMAAPKPGTGTIVARVFRALQHALTRPGEPLTVVEYSNTGEWRFRREGWETNWMFKDHFANLPAADGETVFQINPNARLDKEGTVYANHMEVAFIEDKRALGGERKIVLPRGKGEFRP